MAFLLVNDRATCVDGITSEDRTMCADGTTSGARTTRILHFQTKSFWSVSITQAIESRLRK